MKKNNIWDSKSIKLRKNFVNPKGVEATFANEMTVSHTKREFFISFYRLEPPVILDDEDIRNVRRQKGLDAILYTRLVVTPEFLKATIKALQDNLQKFEDEVGTENEDDDSE